MPLILYMLISVAMWCVVGMAWINTISVMGNDWWAIIFPLCSTVTSTIVSFILASTVKGSLEKEARKALKRQYPEIAAKIDDWDMTVEDLGPEARVTLVRKSVRLDSILNQIKEIEDTLEKLRNNYLNTAYGSPFDTESINAQFNNLTHQQEDLLKEKRKYIENYSIQFTFLQ